MAQLFSSTAVAIGCLNLPEAAAEVEAVLAMRPAVPDVYVCGVQERRFGEVVDAFIVLKSGAVLDRAVTAATSNRDFNPIHQNTDHARLTGAPNMYSNTLFLKGMWEKCVRDFIDLAGTVRGLSGFRMTRFNFIGTIPLVVGQVARKWLECEIGLAEIAMKTVNAGTLTACPAA